MGGGLILWALLVGTLLFADLTNRLVWAALVFTLGYGLIGFADDWLKLTKRNSKGLAGRSDPSGAIWCAWRAPSRTP